VGNTQSPLATQSDFVLDIGARPEADPLGLVPTTSTLLTLALGDALAAALITQRGFGASDFARFHPAGQLGRNLTLTVGEVFQSIDRCARVDVTASLREAVIAMTTYPNGAACILNAEGILMGLITDGDLRRALRYKLVFCCDWAKNLFMPITTEWTRLHTNAALVNFMILSYGLLTELWLTSCRFCRLTLF
jgi:arabinose-5-phosphate isomerase